MWPIVVTVKENLACAMKAIPQVLLPDERHLNRVERFSKIASEAQASLISGAGAYRSADQRQKDLGADSQSGKTTGRSGVDMETPGNPTRASLLPWHPNRPTSGHRAIITLIPTHKVQKRMLVHGYIGVQCRNAK